MILAPRGRAPAISKWVARPSTPARSGRPAPRRNPRASLSIAACLRRDTGTKPCLSDTEVRHARDRVARLGAAISRRVGGSDCSVAKFGDEGRCVGGEAARIRGEAARRSAVGGRGDKPIGMVPKAEVDRLSVSPWCAPRGSEARQGSTRPLYAARVDRRARSANSLCEEPSVRRCCSSWNLI